MLRVNPEHPNDCDKLQRTPLHWASKRGYDNIVSILLDYEAEVSPKDHL